MLVNRRIARLKCSTTKNSQKFDIANLSSRVASLALRFFPLILYSKILLI